MEENHLSDSERARKQAVSQDGAIDHLPALDDLQELDPADITAFRRDGHVVLRGVLSADEVAAFRPAIRTASFAYNHETRALDQRDTYGKAFLQTHNLRIRDPGVAVLAHSRRLGAIAAALLGVDAVRIFHDQSLFKEPGGGSNPTPWHQDQYYWPIEESLMLGFWIPLIDVTPDMGGMLFASGTHQLGCLKALGISDESQSTYEQMIRSLNIQIRDVGPMQTGDISIHHGWTLHAARPNSSQKLREAMILSYFADGLRVAEPVNRHQEHDRLKFLGGRAPGALADHPINRLVYRRT